ncbi:putative ribonuclease H-like domain-containing protein [Tanacetum coccineum]
MVDENLHINFLENKPNVAESGPEWLFDIDSLTKSMNYEPVTVGNQTNGDAVIETNVNAWQAGQEKASDHEYILLPGSDLSEADEKEGYANNTNRVSTVNPSVSAAGQGFDNADDQERIDSSTQDVNTAGPSINTASENINTGSSNINTASPIPNDLSMQSLEATGIFDDAYYDTEEVGAEVDLNNLEKTMNVSSIPTTRIHKDRPIKQIIGDLHSAPLTRRISQQNLEELGLVWHIVDLPKGKRAIGTKWVYRNKKDERVIVVRNKARLVAQGYAQEEGIMDVKSAFLYGTIEEDVYVCQPPSFEDPHFLDKNSFGNCFCNTLENGDMEITATIDEKVKVVSEASIRRHLKLEDSDGISTLPTLEIFEQLALMGASKGYTGVDTPLFQTMLVQGQILQGEGSTIPVESHHTPISASSTSQLPTSPPSMQTTHVAEEAATMPHDSPLLRVHSFRRDEGNMTLNELTVLYTTLSRKVKTLEPNLKPTKLTYGAAYTKLIMKVKKLEHKVKSSKARRRVRLVVSEDEDELEDPSK